MAEPRFNYRAVDPAGRRVRGMVAAPDDAAAFEQLRREGLSPLSLRTAGKSAAASSRRASNLRPRECADFLSNLADLLRAGADIRTALSILETRFEKPAVKALSGRLSDDIAGGEALERAFLNAFGDRQAFIAPMVAAGEAAGDLPGGLQRAADVVYARLKLQEQLISVMAYPGFVLVSAIGALFVILLFIVPSIAPLSAEMGSEPPVALAVMIAASDGLRRYGLLMAVGLGVGGVLTWLAAAMGMLSGPIERALLDGPARRTVSGLVFGAFSLSLGTMLAAGAPMGEALRLAIRSSPSKAARRRLEPAAHAVRQGEYLSNALGGVPGFPSAIVRLVAVGEASNAVGQLLMRGGKIEEEAALRRIETLGRVAGPALIIMLGAILGVLMGGLLSGVSQMGQSALS